MNVGFQGNSVQSSYHAVRLISANRPNERNRRSMSPSAPYRSRTCCMKNGFDGDGAVPSYLSNARRTKENTMKLCHEAVDVADRGGRGNSCKSLPIIRM